MMNYMLSEDASVSLILPATDETHSLEETVRRSAEALPGRTLEFIVVTSPKLTTDQCRSAIARLKTVYGNHIVAFDQHLPGVGGAIREAFSKASGAYTVLMASDLETDPAILPNLIKELDHGADIAATSRWKDGARFAGYDPLKLVLNYFFQLIFRILYATDLTDLTYAYRAYRTNLLRKIRFEETGFTFLFESIVKPLRLGYKAVEVSAPWKARTEGVSHGSVGGTLAYIGLGFRVRFMPRARMLYSAPS